MLLEHDQKEKFYLHGNGLQKDLLFIEIFKAVNKIIMKGKDEIYNGGSKFEYKNIEITNDCKR